MKSSEIREKFLSYFASKGHLIVPSAPMVVKDDPTLMFTNAGMNQFKDIILGHAQPKSKRMADSQKCLRVSGKHNDLEEVGHDTYHHTMFEMLGNWSFGDYFKREAIDYAWEFLTDVMHLDKDRLYATVFEGSEEEKLDADLEAKSYWADYLPEDRIIFGNKHDNFWEMGDMGPCGPCSEIHIDLRSDAERAEKDGKDLVNKDHPLVIEIWNLVFMQFNRRADGSLEPLPQRHVDTGMGFERLCMAVQGKRSNYDTDVFTPIIEEISQLTGLTYGKDDNVDVAMRVVADHVRTIAFSITDGQMPSNVKAGYVIRRILRRAVRYAYTYLNQKSAFLYKLLPVLIRVMGEHYPELEKQKSLIEKVILEEENAFLRTLEKGIRLLDRIIETTKAENFVTIPGRVVFELYDTYGFPLDLTELILREQGLVANRREFAEEMEKQKKRSRDAAAVETDDWIELTSDEWQEFVGYDYLETDVTISKYRKVAVKGIELYQLVFNMTPFYGEGGGQVGDRGTITGEDGEVVEIIDVKKENGLTIHIAKRLPENITQHFTARVDAEKRRMTADNHTATHLLDYALREVLGTHVEQKGSFVNEDRLRFDFSHFQKVTDEELDKVAKIVNRLIRSNIPLEEHRSIPISKAREMGAIALFGEKYGDVVRVVKYGDSVELCGGTHVKSTGELGFFKILSESSVAAGIRRIEAITADRAETYIGETFELIHTINGMFQNTRNLRESIQKLIGENEELRREAEGVVKSNIGVVKEGLLHRKVVEKGITFIIDEHSNLSSAVMKDVAFQLRGECERLVFIAGGVFKEKPYIMVMLSSDLTENVGLHAGQIVKEAAQHIHGGGGGQPFFAMAGGSHPDGLADAVVAVKKNIFNTLNVDI